MTPADRAQIELLRRATPERRMSLALRLSADTIRLARLAISEANPDKSEWERRVIFVRTVHGAELAARYENDLVKRGLLRGRS